MVVNGDWQRVVQWVSRSRWSIGRMVVLGLRGGMGGHNGERKKFTTKCIPCKTKCVKTMFFCSFILFFKLKTRSLGTQPPTLNEKF